jgi:ribonucleoside-diphosphate reductase alpha chain
MIHPGLLREAADKIDDPFEDTQDELCIILRQAADRIEQLEKDGQKSHRERLPDTRQSITHKFKVDTTKGYMIVGLYEDGRPGELFIEIAKEGSTVGGLCDAIGILTSIALQRGVPMEELARKFRATSFEPAGPTLNREQSQATSIIDYVFLWLGRHFCPEFKAEYERLMEAKGSE